ncbi:MAG: hypothetical protein EA397_20315 [Deltaproteobacteria bacterium]|nr:MAG: hypothetical protein EA397_20315 [Deltaproteobacteria bacterium]
MAVHDRVGASSPRHNGPSEGVLTAAGPYALDLSLAGNGPVARVLVDKLADHIPAEVLAKRRAKSKPLVDGFFVWVKGMSQITRPESVLGKALGYAINQERYLRLFLEHGELPMHNNLSELMLRQTVVGRKNWLFARSEGGAHAAATLYTLFGSCYLQGIDPWFYLRDVLDRIQDDPANKLGELTPRNWPATRQGHTG